MARKDRYSEQTKERIVQAKHKKTARRKARKARNARLREEGVKFSKKDSCYKG